MSHRLAPGPEQLVGRARELRMLDAALATVTEGQGVLVVVSGDPGVGKTELCHEVVERARGRGLTAVVGRCWVDGGAPALWPWQPMLQELSADAAADLLSAGTERDACERDRFGRFAAVTEHLAAACRRAPVCLVIDDAHAADVGTLLLARFVARSLARLPLALILTRRTGTPGDSDDTAAALLDDIEAEAMPVVLRPFDLEETTTFLAANGLERLEAGVREALHRVTGGNPLFLRRVAALGAPAVGVAGGGLPAGVQVAIELALDRLSPDAQHVLRVSAVLGPRPPVAVAAAVAGRGAGDVLDAVREGTAAGLVVAEGTEAFAFGHELIRSALEGRLDGATRLDAHAAAVVVMMGADGDGVAGADVDLLARRAYHAAVAAPRSPDDARLAVAACEAAAESMVRSFAYEQAEALLTTAVGLHETSTIGPPPARLLGAWAQAALRCGHMRDSRARFDRAAGAAAAEGDPLLLAETALGQGGHGVKEHRQPDERARVLALQREALAGLPDGAATLRCRLEARLAAEAVVDGAPLEPLLAAVDAARRLGDPQALAEALSLWHHVVLTPEHSRTRLAIADELVEVAAEAGDGVLRLMGAWFRTIDLFHLGDERARASLEDMRARAGAVQSRNIQVNIGVLDVMLLIREGRLAEAAEAAERCRQMGAEAGEVNAFNYFGAQFMGTRWIQGRSHELAGLAEQVAAAPAVVENDFAFRAAAAAFQAHNGNLERARSLLAALGGGDLARLEQSSSWLVGMVAVVELAGALDDAGLARQAYELLSPYRDLPTLGGFAVLCLGSRELALGSAARTFGDLDLAVDHLEAAIAENRRLGHRPMTAIARGTLASVLALRDRGTDRERALALYDHVIADAERMGMTGQADGWRPALAELTAAVEAGGAVEAGEAGGGIGVGAERGAGPDERGDGGEGREGPPANALRQGLIHPVDGRGTRWVVSVGDDRVRVPNLVGLRYLAELLTHPGQFIPALTLASSEGAPGPAARQEVLDDEARAAYAARARELTADLAAAEADNDLARAERLRVELDALVEELESATGLSGRPRAFTDPTERARSSVTKAVKRALTAIDDASPSIAALLRSTVTTGVTCAYLPDLRNPVVWSTHPTPVTDPADATGAEAHRGR